jgi:hypothetical protein
MSSQTIVSVVIFSLFVYQAAYSGGDKKKDTEQVEKIIELEKEFEHSQTAGSTHPCSLEESFQMKEMPLYRNDFARVDFMDFLNPNEKHPEGAKKHLDKIDVPGVIVSAGTERSLFNLILCEKCTGLVVRDINPKVKAYIDFVILALKISKNHEEFKDLLSPLSWPAGSEPKSFREFFPDLTIEELKTNGKKMKIKHEEYLDSQYILGAKKRLKKLRREVATGSRYSTELTSLINSDDLEKMAAIYYKRRFDSDWKTDSAFDEVNYFKNPEHFHRLQDMARKGNIVATIGDVEDLEFLKGTRIAAVDTSNIDDYKVMGDFKFSPDAGNPVIIRTTGVGKAKTTFHSYSYSESKLTPEEKREVDRLIEKNYAEKNFLLSMNNRIIGNGRIKSPQNVDQVFPSYTKQTLDALRLHEEKRSTLRKE